MQSTDNKKHALAAWTYREDFIPTLYIQGDIPTDGQRPVVELMEKEEKKDGELLLEFSPDVYSPKGTGMLSIRNFEKKMKNPTEYKTVTIESKNGTINLTVEVKSREKVKD